MMARTSKRTMTMIAMTMLPDMLAVVMESFGEVVDEFCNVRLNLASLVVLHK